MIDIFKIGDVINIVSSFVDDTGIPIDLSAFTRRTVLKNGLTEYVGSTQQLGVGVYRSTFNTTSYIAEDYQWDIRFTNGLESFSSPSEVIKIAKRVS